MEEEYYKSEALKKLPITKNPNLYTVPEMRRYEGYAEFKNQDELDYRKDHFLNMRTDDIEGARVKRLSKFIGKKTQDFFPDYPDMNKFYNNAKMGAGNIKTLTEIESNDKITNQSRR